MKKIILLGASRQQIPCILSAKKLGCHVITCDYLPDNPGHHYSDEYYNISTTDKESILNLAKKLNIDGIVSYASDPSASTAAYVAEQMDLPTSPYRSVEILSKKDQFRSFLTKNGFNAPKAKGYYSYETAVNDFMFFSPPVFVKPVDSSGSKGISLISDIYGLKEAFEKAQAFSREKRIIIEECINIDSYQVAGDGFSVDGELVFRCFGNDHFDPANLNPFVPVAATFPSIMSSEIQAKVHEEIQRLISLLQMKTGAYNFDIRVAEDGKIYIIEIGPRNGGCYIPQVIEFLTGTDLVEYTIKAALGEDCSELRFTEPRGFCGYFAVHSYKEGVLKDIRIDSNVKKNNIIESYFNQQPGDIIKPYMYSNAAIGIFLMKFSSMTEMLEMADVQDKWIQVLVE
ncbi:MAG: ATP-grasp domain-containing protein [Synergistaceae bacterium]|nr:ATP-grasp domain-containing protein [Synergistaceae bacterium]